MDEQTPASGSQGSSGGGSGKTIGIIIAIIIIALLAWYFTKNGSKNGEETKSGDNNAPAQQQVSGNQPTSLKELMAGSASQKCEVDFSNDTTQSRGTIYVGGGKMRGDFLATLPDGKTMSNHMINDGTTVWTWIDGMGTGYKISASAMSQPATTTPANQPKNVDPSAKYNYNCSGWTQDNSQFTPPANFNFTDMSSLMPTGAGASAGAGSSASMKAQQCAACNSAGASKAQCLAALQCP